MSKVPPKDRRETIGVRLSEGCSLSATALAEEFDVSPDAIRRDLRALAAEGRCRRVYGGALPLSPASTPMRVRGQEAAGRKAALAAAAAAAARIRPGEFLFLDNGSTNLALARALPAIELTVATNSIAIAAALAERDDLQLHVLGGVVRPAIGGCVDADAVAAVQRMNIDLCFLGACAVSLDEGVSAFDPEDAAFKRAALRCSRRAMLLATAEKLATRAPYRVAPLDAIDALVVEHESAGHAEVNAMRTAGIDVVMADLPL
ncbi:DeoR/GlpR family DNA-binding transcription regulator [Aurantiacibacter flavus]|uniref:DeoR/GlpR family DNA-binding transcription regulator n=1 Tax=Aurantiacibacter flavus TaxID=3145232 RepID=A0ABV0CZA6_9SPHN